MEELVFLILNLINIALILFIKLSVVFVVMGITLILKVFVRNVILMILVYSVTQMIQIFVKYASSGIVWIKMVYVLRLKKEVVVFPFTFKDSSRRY